MKFNRYIKESVEDQGRWQDYLRDVPMLRSAVKILNKIESEGFHAYIVGGGVRDIILGEKPKDIDIATNCPMDLLEKLWRTHDIGKSKDFGIVVVNLDGFAYEIAQFREDGKYTDGRRPDSVQVCQSFEGDASRRDFCINAMGINKNGEIIDYFDGKRDIKNKVIRAVGHPLKRFEEDHLRMLRACRFSSRLGFDIECDTKTAISISKENIRKVAPERIKDELMKMASQPGDKFAEAIKMMDEVGILSIILPEIAKMKEFKEMEEWHPEAYDGGSGTVFNHTIAALKRSKVSDPIVNLAVLFHDIGKPESYELIDGKHRFFGHAEKAKDLIDTIAFRLKMSTKEKEAILFAALNHMKFMNIKGMKPSKILKIVSDENWPVLKAVMYCDDSCRTGIFNEKEFAELIDHVEEIKRKWGEKAVNTVVKIIDGQRVMELTGLKPSKTVGDIIRHVTEWAVDNSIKDQQTIENEVVRFFKEKYR